MKRVYGVIGFPLSHSFSKKYFTEKFKREQLNDCSFENFEIADINLFLQFVKTHPEVKGCSITIPYKEKIIPYLTEKESVVAETGACNSIRITDGKLFGFNTDVKGFEESLKSKILPHHTSALILGRGGAAKAVAWVLKKMHIDFKFVERNSKSDSISYNEITKKVIENNFLIINTTPVGMFPETDECPNIPYEYISPEHYLFDLTYNPEKTLFLQKGELQGATIQNGYDMLIIQAEQSWKLWNQH